MYNSIWVMLHKFSGFSMFFKRLLLDFASCMCVSSGWGETVFKASQDIPTNGVGCHLPCPWEKVPPSPEVLSFSPWAPPKKQFWGSRGGMEQCWDVGAAALPQHREPEMQGVSLEGMTPVQSPGQTHGSGSCDTTLYQTPPEELLHTDITKTLAEAQLLLLAFKSGMLGGVTPPG